LDPQDQGSPRRPKTAGKEKLDLVPQADDVADHQIFVHAVQGRRGCGGFGLSSNFSRTLVAVG
jgi:hypothetical protein